jgi:hypothetical protein
MNSIENNVSYIRSGLLQFLKIEIQPLYPDDIETGLFVAVRERSSI